MKWVANDHLKMSLEEIFSFINWGWIRVPFILADALVHSIPSKFIPQCYFTKSCISFRSFPLSFSPFVHYSSSLSIFFSSIPFLSPSFFFPSFVFPLPFHLSCPIPLPLFSPPFPHPSGQCRIDTALICSCGTQL